MSGPGLRTQWFLALLPTIIILVLAVVLLTLFRQRQAPEDVNVTQDAMLQAEILQQAQTLIREHYYRDDYDADHLFHDAMEGMVAALGDRYSDYLDPEDMEAFEQDTSGRLVGLGVRIERTEGDRVRIITALPGSPAIKAGLQPGDLIVGIDGRDVRDLGYDATVELIKGEEGSPITLEVERRNGTLATVSLERAIVKTPSVVHWIMIGRGQAGTRNPYAAPESPYAQAGRQAGVGYLRITSWQSDTVGDVRAAVADLEDRGLRSLILDLRGNRGGLLLQSVELAGAFLQPGDLIVYRAGRDLSAAHTHRSEQESQWPDLPLVVLVDASTASASEIFAGAVQDYQRAFLVGERTFGKGLVQERFYLPGDQTALKLTTARYFTPAGRCIQKDADRGYRGGLEPDVSLRLTDREFSYVRFLWRDQTVIGTPYHSPEVEDLLAEPLHDRQLEAAVRLLNGESVPSDVPSVARNGE